MEAAHPADDYRLDLVTPLPLEHCLHALKHGAKHSPNHFLAVRVEGQRVLIVRSTLRRRDGQAAGIWLFRFQGSLTSTDIGTHVQGVVVRNRYLESVLAVPGIITGVFCVLGITLAVPFVATFSLFLLLMLAGFYVTYQRLLNRQAHDLVHWMQEWLLIPQGRAGETLP